MKKLGLVLSGGTAKGFAHLGVLEVFEKNKIKIDYIAGTSIGAVIGALYSSGLSVNELKEIAKKTKWSNLVDFTLPDRGILSGKKIEDFLRNLLKNKKFEDLKIPLAVVATDVYKGEKVIFNKGDVVNALRASISIPSLFVPFEYDNRILVDGGLIDPLPNDVVRDMGAKIVIGVDLSTKIKKTVLKSRVRRDHSFVKKMETKAIREELEEINKYISIHKDGVPWLIRFIFSRPKKIIDFFGKHRLKEPELLAILHNSFSIMTNELSRRSLESTDYVIKPDLDKFSSFDFDKIQSIIQKGHYATEKSIKKIKKLLK